DVVRVDELASAVDVVAVEQCAPHVPHQALVGGELRIRMRQQLQLAFAGHLAGDRYRGGCRRIAAGAGGSSALAGAALGCGGRGGCFGRALLAAGGTRREHGGTGGNGDNQFHETLPVVVGYRSVMGPVLMPNLAWWMPDLSRNDRCRLASGVRAGSSRFLPPWWRPLAPPMTISGSG